MEALPVVKARIRARMRFFGRKDGMPANEGNQNKKIRIDTNLTEEEVMHASHSTASAQTDEAAMVSYG